MNIKWLVLSIALMITSLMQATFYTVTNTSRTIKKIYFLDNDLLPITDGYNIEPNKTIKLDIKPNLKVYGFAMVDEGIWYDVKERILHAKTKERVTINLKNYGYCTIQKRDVIVKTRGIIRSPFLQTSLEKEQEGAR